MVLFCLCFWGPQAIHATHLVGGTMVYQCLSNNNFLVTLTVYRDCSSATPFDNSAPIAVYDGNGNLISTQMVPFSGSSAVPIIINNPCLVSPPNVCIEKTEYTFAVNLPPNLSGYEIVYQRCCRNGAAVNVINPLMNGSTYKAFIPGITTPCNNSPVFNNPPPTIMCAGYQFDYDLSATDIDGDSLYYCFGDALIGASQQNPAPGTPTSSPHSSIPWAAGYSTNYQIDANPQFTIDGQTGFLTGFPTSSGFYTFCIKVKEYRNGVFIDEIYRDFLLTVTSCQTNTIADFPAQNDYCFGTTLQFSNNSLNASLFYWDFGDPATNADTSLLQTPTYTYTDTGVYNIMLVANPGYFCADTIYQQFQIHPEINPSFLPPADQCLQNNGFNFNAIGNNHQDDTITWNFGAMGIPTSVSGASAQVSFPTSGTHPIELTIENFGCIGIYHDTVTIYDNPVADFPPQATFCNGLSVSMLNNSTNASDYFWDFDDNSNSILTTPTHTYPDSGIYNIMLIANQQSLCYDTAYQTYQVYPPLEGTFPTPATQCLPNNLFALDAVGNFNAAADINWDFGPLGTPSTGHGAHVQVSFLDTGFYPVHLTIQNYGCSSSYTDTLRVFPTPDPDFTILADTGCQPFSTTFTNQSHAWTPLYYYWDFGDGNYSTAASPSHTYLSHGNFDVSLTIATDSGCIDTVSLFNPNLITVNPKPFSNFMLNPIETYFLNHELVAEDRSDVLHQEFHFGDGAVFTDRYVEYSYQDTGHYLFEQFVTNEFDCQDTSGIMVWIKPDFLFYVPNAFTPDGDGLNDIFLPKIQGILSYELRLFNRWGELFFSTKTLTEGWDGTYNNRPSPIGVYNWRIEVTTIDHQIHKRVGHFNLIR